VKRVVLRMPGFARHYLWKTGDMYLYLIYLEFITDSVCQSDNSVFGYTGSCVHATGKYGFKGLFLKNNPFNRFLTLQFSGLRLVSFFTPCLMPVGGCERQLDARY
jgi:hypothetical protein